MKFGVISSFTRGLLGIDFVAYRKWIRYQMTPDMNWSNVDIYQEKAISLFKVYTDGGLREAFSWVNTQLVLKKAPQPIGNKFGFLTCRLQFGKGNQVLTLNEEGVNQNFHWWDI